MVRLITPRGGRHACQPAWSDDIHAPRQLSCASVTANRKGGGSVYVLHKCLSAWVVGYYCAGVSSRRYQRRGHGDQTPPDECIDFVCQNVFVCKVHQLLQLFVEGGGVTCSGDWRSRFQSARWLNSTLWCRIVASVSLHAVRAPVFSGRCRFLLILVTVSHHPWRTDSLTKETWNLLYPPPPPLRVSHFPELNFPFFSVSQEIGRVRKDMYNDTLNGGMFNGRDMEELPEPIGPVAQLQEKLYVPVKEFPDVSGRQKSPAHKQFLSESWFHSEIIFGHTQWCHLALK